MALIGFSDNPDEVWCVAGWVFRQVLDDVISQYPGDSDIADEFARSETYSGLSVDLLEPELAAKVTNALRQVATGILTGVIRSGIHDQPYGDATTVEQYQKALQKLLKILPSA
jgi:hypothetical protein